MEPRALAQHDGARDEDVVGAAARKVAGELPEGTLGLAFALENLAFDHDLGPGRDVEVHRLSAT